MTQFLVVESGVRKSPPTTIRVFLFLTAIELAPVVGFPCAIGRSMILSLIKRRECRPPVTKQAASLPIALMLVPLAAKHASPLSATGYWAGGIFCQSLPPVNV